MSPPAPAGLPVSIRRRIARARLAAQLLDPPAGTPRHPAEPAAVVGQLVALQAQEWGSGIHSVGLRTGLGRAQVEQAIADRLVVRTWPMRGTLHLVAAQDARWLTGLLAGAPLRAARARQVSLDLTDAVVDEAREVVLRAVERRPVSRPEVFATLERHGLPGDGRRGYHLLARFCMEGLVCQGPRAGREPTFVSLDTWVGPTPVPDRERAMAVLAARYVRSHGPVREQDLAAWSGQSLGFAREALQRAGDELVAETVAGQRLWRHESAPAASRRPLPLLLPPWDEAVLGYRDRSALIPDADSPSVMPPGGGMFRPTVVVGGQVVGVWSRTTRAAAVDVVVHPFRPLSASVERAVRRASESYGRFLQTAARIRVEQPDVGSSSPPKVTG